MRQIYDTRDAAAYKKILGKRQWDIDVDSRTIFLKEKSECISKSTDSKC